MSHVRWEDLLEETPAATSGTSAVPSAPPSLEEVAAVDSELASLLSERKQLEGKMNALLGVEPEPVDARTAKQFPVVEHTPESRIAERRQHERDTARRLLEQKLYARRKSEAADAERVEELRRTRVEYARSERRREQKLATLRQQWARKARERAKQAARLAERLMLPPVRPSGGSGEEKGTRDAARRLVEAAEQARAAARGKTPMSLPLPGARRAGGGARLDVGRLAVLAREARGLKPASLDVDTRVSRGLSAFGMDMDSMERQMDMELERDGDDAMDSRDAARDARRDDGRRGARDE